MFHALATKQEFWKERLNIFIAMAPVILPNKKFLLFDIGSRLEAVLENRLSASNIYELFGKNWDNISKTVRVLVPGFSQAVLTAFTLVEDNDREQAKMFLGHFPQGASVRQTTHYGQIITAKQFKYYDYNNPQKNMEKYGQESPPHIDVETISDVPIAMFSTKHDKIVNIADNREYAGRIPAVIEHNELEGDHFTFLLAKDMSWYTRVNDLLDEYSPLELELVNPEYSWLPKEDTEDKMDDFY